MSMKTEFGVRCANIVGHKNQLKNRSNTSVSKDMFLKKELLLIIEVKRMGGKPYKDWEEVKKDIVKWRNINIGCLVIALLFVIAGAAAEILEIDFRMASTSYFLLALIFAVISIAPHIQVVALKSWYGVESERKK
ncbi:Uncharacterised protein [uncultured archaeon]|nr:Uncharacterised protein [uncultured archaeon]